MSIFSLPKQYYKVLFYIATIAVFTLATVPSDHLTLDFEYADKIKHFSAFFTLSLLLNRASSTITHRLRNMGALLLFGIFIEIVQKYLVYRSSSIYDIYADLVGILMFQLIYSLYRFIKEQKSK